MTPTNKLKPRLYSYPYIGYCSLPTVFPKYTFFSNESRCQNELLVGYDEDHSTCSRDSKTQLVPFIHVNRGELVLSDALINRLTTLIG